MTTIPSTTLRIVCVQANPTVGALRDNFAIIRHRRAQYRGKADLLVFSECFGTGYPLQDLVLRPGFRRDFRAALDTLAGEMRGDGGPAVLVGGPLDGAALPYNAAFLIETDGSMKIVLKHTLPNDEVYDEKRVFAPGPLPSPVDFRGFRLGIAICEDFWHGKVAQALAAEGAEILIVPNGSHFRTGKQAVRVAIGRRTVRATGLPILYVNQVGGQDSLVFDGGSYVMDRAGLVITQAGFRECDFDITLERGEDGGVDLRRGDVLGMLPNGYPDEPEAMYRALVLGLRDYVNKNGFPGVVLGMSGGIDSALSAAVAVDALGADRVLPVRMPSPYTSAESMEDAERAAALLGTRLLTVPIAPAMDAFGGMLAPVFADRPVPADDTTFENVQARIRGMTLMALSNRLGLMVLSTGNKSEMSVGYATLYGDMCGGYSVLKDVYKTLVFGLARWRNTHGSSGLLLSGLLGPQGAVMPDRIIAKPPSAELREYQTDEQALGAYEHLDAVLATMVEGLNGADRAAELASAAVGQPISTDYAGRIGRMAARAQYKRDQSPPGVVVTERTYGPGWRLPVTNHYGL
ncbi:NAD+ synthase [Azospirillum lipoferum]|uniref:Glutamine-dependent NAD(+) synthetase n=1 Tax=Azospirillum lipoferum TaxID=193 RepID=A0A5A9GLU9_AZOLI|nr:MULTISPECIES: NAD+ synthase [Azospirillum]KAA0595440.1 NAD+ synthase [Azospirillum lipoferum]MCP1611652.1 NAD+ synthase [Azospirillum lipoferum]MDW5533589.1 NAD+ synthase [Azospirillum sp. NL1]